MSPNNFLKKKCPFERQTQVLRVTTSTKISALKASFLVDDHITKAKKPFTNEENLILSVTKDICRELFGGDELKKKVANVPFRLPP